MWVVGDSPVVPLTTRPSAPSATSCLASCCAASKSTAPSAFMGVTMAGRIRPKGAGSSRCIVPSVLGLVIRLTVLPSADAFDFMRREKSHFGRPADDDRDDALQESDEREHHQRHMVAASGLDQHAEHKRAERRGSDSRTTARRPTAPRFRRCHGRATRSMRAPPPGTRLARSRRRTPIPA